MAQTVQGNLDRPKGSKNLVYHRRPQNSFSNLFLEHYFGGQAIYLRMCAGPRCLSSIQSCWLCASTQTLAWSDICYSLSEYRGSD